MFLNNLKNQFNKWLTSYICRYSIAICNESLNKSLVIIFTEENRLQVFIDSNGDAEGNFTVVALLDDKEMNGSLRMSMQPVGYFQYQLNETDEASILPVSFALYFTSLICYFEFFRDKYFAFYKRLKSPVTLWYSLCTDIKWNFVLPLLYEVPTKNNRTMCKPSFDLN